MGGSPNYPDSKKTFFFVFTDHSTVYWSIMLTPIRKCLIILHIINNHDSRRF